MTPTRVLVQIRRPTGTDPGQIGEGFYIVTDGVLSMVAPDGSPLEDKQGVPVIKTHILRPSDSAEAIAKVLTRKVRRQMLGLTETEEAFGRPLEYARGSVA